MVEDDVKQRMPEGRRYRFTLGWFCDIYSTVILRCCLFVTTRGFHRSPELYSFFAGLVLACVAWRFCRAGRRSGVAAKFALGFSALARLYYLARPTKTAMLRRLAWSLSIISMPGTGQVRFKMQTVTCGLRIWIARGQVHENVGVYEQIHNLIGFSFSEVNDLPRIALNSVRTGKYK